MEKIQEKTIHRKLQEFARASTEARRRLKQSIPLWLKEGWTLSPVIITIDPKDNSKKCTFLTKDGKPGSPRIVIKNPEDLPISANAILGTNKKYAIIDIDVVGFKLPLGFKQPFKIVSTGRPEGRHCYFHNGDIEGSQKLICGELNCITKGIFLPGSYHAPSGKYYTKTFKTHTKDKLYKKDINLLLSKKIIIANGKQEKWEKGNRNNLLFKKIAMDLEKNQGRNIPAIVEQAEKSGLGKEEVIRTAKSAMKKAIGSGIDPGPQQENKKTTGATPEVYKGFSPIAEPREWFLNEKIFIKRRDNQITGDAGVGKSTLTREKAYQFWKKKGTVLLFAQEDDSNEDIAPWLISKGFKEGEEIPRFHVFTDWYDNPIEQTILDFKHIENKMIIIDPVHALFVDITKPSACRKMLINIRDNLSAKGDTRIYVNHPKSFWKENKLSGSELNASSKELSRICRGSTICREDKENPGFVIIEHTKKQLNGDRYSFKIAEEFITNRNGKHCTYSYIESFHTLNKQITPDDDTVLPQTKNLSKRRENLRKQIESDLLALSKLDEKNPWVEKKDLINALGLKDNETKKLSRVNKELAEMVNEGKIKRKQEGKFSLYSPYNV